MVALINFNIRLGKSEYTGIETLSIISGHKKSLPIQTERVLFFLVRLRGIEPPHTVPETIALSTELQAQKLQWNYTTDVKLMQRKAFFFVLCALICYNNIINLMSMYYLGHAL